MFKASEYRKLELQANETQPGGSDYPPAAHSHCRDQDPGYVGLSTCGKDTTGLVPLHKEREELLWCHLGHCLGMAHSSS